MNTTTPVLATPDLSTIGTKHRALWASGDYPAVAADLIPDLGTTLVEAAGVAAGQRVLDIGAGTGNAAIPAALAGADVVASDLTPELLAAGERIAAARGANLQWVEADAHALPFEDGEFDTVLSCVGVMFAPFHERAAAQLLRVCRPGGTIGLLSWTPEGFREWWKANYGPTIAVYRGLDPDRAAQLDAAFLRMLQDTHSDGGWEAEYLLVTAVRT